MSIDFAGLGGARHKNQQAHERGGDKFQLGVILIALSFLLFDWFGHFTLSIFGNMPDLNNGETGRWVTIGDFGFRLKIYTIFRILNKGILTCREMVREGEAMLRIVRGISPPGPNRTGRDSLPSPDSYPPVAF